MISLRIPWPPSANHLYAVANGRKILSAEGKAYHWSVIRAVREQLGTTRPMLADRLRVVFNAFVPDRRKRDLSNLLKAAEDALTIAGVWVDDSQIDDLRIVRRAVVDDGRLDVVVEAITESTP